MEQNSSLKAHTCPVSQESQVVRYHVHKRPPLDLTPCVE